MWWAIWCAAAMAGASAAPPSDAFAPLALDLPQIDSLATDDESLGYAGPAGRFAAPAPLLYLLPDLPRDTQRAIGSSERRARPKRKMPSLSINNPMEVLRQRLMLEVARKQMREASQRQAVANRLFLQNVGKRGFWANAGPAPYDN